MSTLSQAVQDYLEMRRALGYKLAEHGRVLPQFVAFLEQRDAPLITIALALEFATQPMHASVVWRHIRLAIVRGFAIYLQALDARHEVPPANLLPARYRRAIPYLYSDAEIDALMQAAHGLRPALRRHVRDADRLLSVTGMRISEACGLEPQRCGTRRAAANDPGECHKVRVRQERMELHGSAGINRHGAGDENALHRRPSESRWPRVMRWRSVRAQRSVGRGRAGGAIGPRNSEFGEPTLS